MFVLALLCCCGTKNSIERYHQNLHDYNLKNFDEETYQSKILQYATHASYVYGSFLSSLALGCHSFIVVFLDVKNCLLCIVC